MSDENNQKTGFSEDYVKELRQENAGWRTKVRDLEEKLQLNELKTELLQHGANVNPKWVEIREGQSVGDAVRTFLDEYPQFITTNTGSNNTATSDSDNDKGPTFKNAPKPNTTTKSNSNNVGPKANSGSFGGRNLDEIRKDPKARASLRDQYREMLALQSNKKYGD